MDVKSSTWREKYVTRYIACCISILILLLCSNGCHTSSPCVNKGHVDAELQWRMSQGVATCPRPGEVTIPSFVNLEDGLSEEEAVALALWNNRDFLATLSQLGIARGDLVQAGLLTNPQLNLLFPPIGTKQLEWTLFVPLEAIILRKYRVEIAERDFQRIANELVQNGLNVARDARVAYADYQFAINRYDLSLKAVKVRQGIADLARKRLDAGDIGELEAIATQIDANTSKAEQAGLKEAVSIAETLMKNVLGIATYQNPIELTPEVLPSSFELDEEALVNEALAIRPDMTAANFSIQAATKSVELARKSFMRIDAVADGNSGGFGPTNSGPGLRFEIPIFNRNQGLIIRSQWTVDQANHNYYAVHDRIITEVETSISSVRQANSNLRLLQEEVLPYLEDSIQLAEKAYRGGGEGYFLVLQTTSQYIDSKIQELQLKADLRKSLAELDRSVGKRVIHNEGQNIEPLPNPVLPPATTSAKNDEPDFE